MSSPCAAGRYLIDKNRLGWGEPCPEVGTVVLVLSDIAQSLRLCDAHMAELEQVVKVDEMDPRTN